MQFYACTLLFVTNSTVRFSFRPVLVFRTRHPEVLEGRRCTNERETAGEERFVFVVLSQRGDDIYNMFIVCLFFVFEMCCFNLILNISIT